MAELYVCQNCGSEVALTAFDVQVMHAEGLDGCAVCEQEEDALIPASDLLWWRGLSDALLGVEPWFHGPPFQEVSYWAGYAEGCLEIDMQTWKDEVGL